MSKKDEQIDIEEAVEEAVSERLDKYGHEMPDPKPVEMPAGFKRPESLAETVQRLVRHQVSEEAAAAGYETFEEASDFDIPDDPIDPNTPYEVEFDPILGREVTPAEFRANAEIYKEIYAKEGKNISRDDLVEALRTHLGPDFSLAEQARESSAAGADDKEEPPAEG